MEIVVPALSREAGTRDSYARRPYLVVGFLLR
jgi:hypothetical protein